MVPNHQPEESLGWFYVPKDGWFVENPRILDLDAIYAIYGDVKQPVCASIFDPK